MTQIPSIFLELRRGITYIPIHVTLSLRQNIPHLKRIEIKPVGIMLTWDTLAQWGFGVEDIICLCKQEMELLRHEFTPSIAPGYVRDVFMYRTHVGKPACLELVLSQKDPYRIPSRAADIIPIFSHYYDENVG